MNKLILLLLTIFSLKISAQVATIDSKKVFAAVPEMAKLDTLAAREQQKYQDEFTPKVRALQLQREVAEGLAKKNPSDAATKAAQEKLEQMAQEAQKYQDSANKKLADYRNLLYKPYYDKINAAIKTVAERRKYMQVMDIQSVALAYASPAADITDDVVKELGK